MGTVESYRVKESEDREAIGELGEDAVARYIPKGF